MMLKINKSFFLSLNIFIKINSMENKEYIELKKIKEQKLEKKNFNKTIQNKKKELYKKKLLLEYFQKELNQTKIDFGHIGELDKIEIISKNKAEMFFKNKRKEIFSTDEKKIIIEYEQKIINEIKEIIQNQNREIEVMESCSLKNKINKEKIMNDFKNKEKIIENRYCKKFNSIEQEDLINTFEYQKETIISIEGIPLIRLETVPKFKKNLIKHN